MRHIKNLRKKLQNNKCPVCEFKFSQDIDLQNHIRLHTGETPFDCRHCSAKFNSKANLASHIRSHHKKN